MAAFTPTARVIADSISPDGHRLSTLEVRLHRFVLAEFNTHRALSRNSASSRAVPVRRLIEAVRTEPAIPLVWPTEQPGMRGGADLPDTLAAGPGGAVETWLAARDCAVLCAEYLASLGTHKSVVNRLLEPFAPHTLIVSGTDWDNFWTQRCSPLAQPEIRAAAQAMKAAYDASVPRRLRVGQWHLPYIRDGELPELLDRALKVSAARCARVSYLTHDGRRDPQADINLYDRLIAADPPHASPLEHVATPGDGPGNFTGWRQLRHLTLGS